MNISKKWAPVAVVSAALLAVAGMATVAVASDPVLTQASFAPSGTWSWVNDASLGNTASLAQYAQADISGLSDADHNAGFRLRYGSSNILVAVSGTAWKIEPSGGGIVGGSFSHAASGNLKTTIDSAGVVNILWNGASIASRTVSGSYPGLGVVPSVWQSTATVKMTNIEAGTFGTPTPTPTTSSTTVSPTTESPSPTTESPSPTPTDSGTVTVTPTVTAPAVTITPTVTAPAVTVTPTVTAPAVTVTPTVTATPTDSPTSSPTSTTESPSTTSESPTPTPTSTSPTEAAAWLSGASSIYAANGTFGTWRGEPVKIVGTWSDSQDCSASVCSFETTGDMAGVQGQNISLDIAVGAIWSGQSWANAANGSYNGQWTNTLNALKSKLQTKNMDPSKVYIRFAHEMNGDWTDWHVATGQEANFRAAISRFSALRYQIFGATNAPKVVLCANDGSSGGQADPRNLFVGKDSSNRQVVDVYCIDTYNQYPHRTDAAAIWSAFNDVSNHDSIEFHRQFAESVGVPFSIGEWGNCGIASQCAGGGGESPAYVQQMNRYFRAHAGDLANPAAGQLLYEVQFNLWDRFALYGSQANQPLTSAAYASAVWGV